MKTVFTGRETIHVWAQQTQEYGRNPQGNIYFHGKTIYSYGPHYPMATFVEGRHGKVVVINSLDTSVTTKKHLGWISSAIPDGIPIILAPIRPLCIVGDHELDVYSWEFELHTYTRENLELRLGMAGRATKNGQWHLELATDTLDMYRRACRILGIDAQDMPEPTKADAKRIAERDRAARVERERQRAERLEVEREQDANQFHEWRAGHNVHFPRSYAPKDGTQLLTVKHVGGEYVVETSEQARFPVDHARRAFRMIERACTEETTDNLSIRLGNYVIRSIENGIIYAGCHRVTMDEVKHCHEMILDIVPRDC